MNPPNVKDESKNMPSFLLLADGRRIAYHLTEGKEPSVIFMGGFMSDMTGSKALALEAYCQRIGQRFIRFDYTGHGESSLDFREGTIGSWKQDTLDVIDQLGSENNILIGSSMGGWIMLLAALDRPQKITALIGIASAPDFTENLIAKQMTDEQKQAMDSNNEIILPSCNGEDPYPITAALIEDGRTQLVLDKPLAIHVPIRLIHGLEDEDVPWDVSVTLCKHVASDDVQVHFIKGAGHRLSEPKHIKILTQTLNELLTMSQIK